MLKEMTIVLLGMLSALTSDVCCAVEKKLVLATHESIPYSGKNLKKKGILSEIVTAAFEKEGYKTEIKVLPWKRGFEKTKNGLYDGIFGCWYRTEREQWFVYSKPLLANNIIFLKKAGASISFDGDYTSLKNYRIGYIRGYAYPSKLNLIKDSINTDVVTTNLQNLKKLATGRLDLIMIDRLLSRHIIRSEMPGFRNIFEETDRILAHEPNYVAFSRKTTDLESKISAFNRGLDIIKKEGVIEKIIKKHGLWAQHLAIIGRKYPTHSQLSNAPNE